MGSLTSEASRGTDEDQHQVTLSAYRMSKYETSNAQFAAFLNAKSIGSNGIYALGAYPTQALIAVQSGFGLTWTGTQWQPDAGRENFPAVLVTWFGAVEFATYAGGRLPSEAEWEYACRGNTTSPFNTGVCLNASEANYQWGSPYSGCFNGTPPYNPVVAGVISYSPNAYGLHNMHGNVFEWCSDWYGPYNTTSQINPVGPSTGTSRVIRGGSYLDAASGCRSARRYYTDASFIVGFRLAFAP